MPQVTLTAPHTHAGVEYEAGRTLTVSDDEAQWLAGQNVIAPVQKQSLKKEKADE